MLPEELCNLQNPLLYYTAVLYNDTVAPIPIQAYPAVDGMGLLHYFQRLREITA
jgi:hypothetical protein